MLPNNFQPPNNQYNKNSNGIIIGVIVAVAFVIVFILILRKPGDLTVNKNNDSSIE